MSDYYLGCDWYLENYIISEQMENYRRNSCWHHWAYRGLIAARTGDSRFIVGWEILDSEYFCRSKRTQKTTPSS